MLGQVAPCGTGDCDVLIDMPEASGTSFDEDTHQQQDTEVETDLGFDFAVPQADSSIKRKVVSL
jgi:hypothetical protein